MSDERNTLRKTERCKNGVGEGCAWPNKGKVSEGLRQARDAMHAMAKIHNQQDVSVPVIRLDQDQKHKIEDPGGEHYVAT